MGRFIFLRKILFLFAVFGILLAMNSCDNATMTDVTINPFIGTWEQVGNSNVHFVFTETDATGYVFNMSLENNILWAGTYTFNDTRLTIQFDPISTTEGMLADFPEGTMVYLYKFENGLLQISVPSDPSNLDTPFVLDFSMKRITCTS